MRSHPRLPCPYPFRRPIHYNPLWWLVGVECWSMRENGRAGFLPSKEWSCLRTAILWTDCWPSGRTSKVLWRDRVSARSATPSSRRTCRLRTSDAPPARTHSTRCVCSGGSRAVTRALVRCAGTISFMYDEISMYSSWSLWALMSKQDLLALWYKKRGSLSMLRIASSACMIHPYQLIEKSKVHNSQEVLFWIPFLCSSTTNINMLLLVVFDLGRFGLDTICRKEANSEG